MTRSILLAIASFLVILFPAFASQDMYYEADNVSVHLRQAPCDSSLIAVFLAPVGPSPKAAAVRFEGRDFAACWVIDKDGQVVLMDEEGDGGSLQPRFFTDKPAPKGGSI